MNKKLFLVTLCNVILASIYILAISLILTNADEYFGNLGNSALGPFPFLLLFSLSAAIVGGLIFGYSVYLFLNGEKKESIKATLYSIGWLGLITIVVIMTYAWL